MKLKKLLQRAIPVMLGFMLICLGAFGVLAEDSPGNTDIPAEQTTEEQYEPETEPIYTDPYIEPTTQYVEPVTEEQFTEPETEAVETVPETEEQTTQEQTVYIGEIVTQSPDVTEFVPPTLPKTISQKTYSTNYTAGIISWICVIVGVVVVVSVLVSTKVSGRKASKRRI